MDWRQKTAGELGNVKKIGIALHNCLKKLNYCFFLNVTLLEKHITIQPLQPSFVYFTVWATNILLLLIHLQSVLKLTLVLEFIIHYQWKLLTHSGIMLQIL